MMQKIVKWMAIFAICLSCCGCSRQTAYHYTITDTFDTVIEVICTTQQEADHYGKMAEENLKYWHKLCDAYHPYATGGGVYIINQSGGNWVEVTDHMLQLLQFGIEAYQKTGGAVNMMSGAVTALWKDTQEPPSDTQLKEALKHISMDALEIDGNRVRLRDPLARLDVGAFAKGYALQQTAQRMNNQFGFRGLISAVSSVVVVGNKDGHPYRVGIGDQAGGIAAKLSLEDIALSTSGTDQRYFTHDGKRYHHIIDLATGFPADSGISQASVVHADAGWADVYSTAALITGKPYGDTLLRRDGKNEYYGKMEELL